MNWIKDLGKVTQDVEMLFSDLSEVELNWKPQPEAWSIAQNLEHLIVVNETYFPVLASLKEGTYKAPFMAKLSFMVPFLGKTVLKAVQPDRKKKMKTFLIWEPSSSEVKPGIIMRFKSHQTELQQKIDDSKELIKKNVVISSPANRNIVYKLETAFEIIVTHEQRHLEQAREILSILKK